jgi:two-component system, cell cycle response regulator DivK
MEFRKFRVLCVEHRAEHMEVLNYMLNAAGYEVVPAVTGTEGLLLMATQEVDGVLLEYDLPDATGSAIRARMVQMKPEIPVLLFAGVGPQTAPLLHFFDSYLRRSSRLCSVTEEVDA